MIPLTLSSPNDLRDECVPRANSQSLGVPLLIGVGILDLDVLNLAPFSFFFFLQQQHGKPIFDQQQRMHAKAKKPNSEYNSMYVIRHCSGRPNPNSTSIVRHERHLSEFSSSLYMEMPQLMHSFAPFALEKNPT